MHIMDKKRFIIPEYFNIYRYGMMFTGAWPYQSKVFATMAMTFFTLQHISIFVPEV